MKKEEVAEEGHDLNDITNKKSKVITSICFRIVSELYFICSFYLLASSPLFDEVNVNSSNKYRNCVSVITRLPKFDV
jgi:hypothetical protein